MNKYFVLLNVDNNKYWTGRYWDRPYSTDIREAKQFINEESLIEEISMTEEENHSIKQLLSEVNMFKVEVIYCVY
jgi:hypothetical protein